MRLWRSGTHAKPGVEAEPGAEAKPADTQLDVDSPGTHAQPESEIELALASAAQAVAELDAVARRAQDVIADGADRVRVGSESRDRIATELLTSLERRVAEIGEDAGGLRALLDRARGHLAQLRSSSAPEPAINEGPPAPAPVMDDGSSEPAANHPVEPEPEPVMPAGESPIGPGPPRQPMPSRAESEGMRLLATQMSVAGASRDDIEARLRQEFGAEGVGHVLDEPRVADDQAEERHATG